MASYRFSAAATRDLKNIYRHGVLQFGEAQADQYFDVLLARFEQIAEQPYLYPSVENIRSGYRRSVCGVDSIYYRVGDQVEIMRIIGKQEF